MKKIILTFIAAMSSVVFADTVFDNGDGANNFITNALNWNNGLPVGQQGTISINAGFDSDQTMVNYDIIHSAGTVSRANGLFGLNVGSGSTWLANGTAAYSNFRGLSVSAGGAYTQEAGVTGDFTNNNRDSQIADSGSSIIINGGTFSVGRDLIIRNEADFTINGGILTIADQILTQGFASAFNSLNFNGGTTTADNFQFDTAGTATFGGTTAGSLTLNTSLGNGVTLDWTSGSLMALTVAGADLAFYQGLYSASSGNQLRFEGSNSAAFADNFSVSGSTLTIIPEPSTFALLGLAGLVVVLFRRRK
jgi:hypothetical protein